MTGERSRGGGGGGGVCDVQVSYPGGGVIHLVSKNI